MYSKNLFSSTRNWASFEISLQTYRRRIYVWSNDVTLNHMPYLFLYVIILKRVSSWRVKTLSIVSSSPKLPRSFYEIWRETEAILKVMRGRERLILQVDGDDRAQKPPDMRTRALATVSCIPAFRFSKWRRTNQNLTRHCGRCQAAVLALRIFQHR